MSNTLLRPLAADRPPWERQPNESHKAFGAFVVYRDLGADRSLARVARDLGKHPSQIERWSATWQWTLRAGAYDDDLERRQRAANEAEQQKMLRAHAQEAAAGRRSLMEPVKIFLQRLKDGVLDDLDDRELIALCLSAVRPLASLQQAERLARGLPESSIEVAGAVEHRHEVVPLRDLSRLSIPELEVLHYLLLRIDGNDGDQAANGEYVTALRSLAQAEGISS